MLLSSFPGTDVTEKEKQDVSQRKEGQALPKAQSPVTAAAQGPELQAEGARYQGRVGEQ